MAVQRRKRTVVDRTTIALRLRDGWGIRQIALGLGLSPGTVSDEVSRNGGCANYEAGAADGQASAKRELTGRKARMAPDGALFTETARLLGLGWSPEQISGRRKREDAGLQQESGLRVSHEAIYALPRGELRRELIGCLRHARPDRGRKPKGNELRGKLVGMTNIKDRPEEVEGRLVPGHWEWRSDPRRQGSKRHRHAGPANDPLRGSRPHARAEGRCRGQRVRGRAERDPGTAAQDPDL